MENDEHNTNKEKMKIKFLTENHAVSITKVQEWKIWTRAKTLCSSYGKLTWQHGGAVLGNCDQNPPRNYAPNRPACSQSVV